LELSVVYDFDRGVVFMVHGDDRVRLNYEMVVELHKCLSEFIAEMDRRDKTPEVLA
jgi:hypothetical protein